jgi:hypothetical protein
VDQHVGVMNWDKRGVVTRGISCTQGWGVGLYDLGLRFHDIKLVSRSILFVHFKSLIIPK